MSIRQLRADEPLPAGEPKRYRNSHGYIRLRWWVGPKEHVEVYEHRLIAGFGEGHVHHVNGLKNDNRPSNLKQLTPTEHGAAHTAWPLAEAMDLYRAGWSLVRLARRYQIPTVTIMRALKKRGVIMRTLKEAWVARKAAGEPDGWFYKKCHSDPAVIQKFRR